MRSAFSSIDKFLFLECGERLVGIDFVISM